MIGDELLRLACLTYGDDDHPERWAQARALLTDDPSLGRANIWAAATTNDVEVVRQLLADDPAAANAEGGPSGWAPLLYLAYSRLDPDVPGDSVLTIARLLLEAGADPNAGFQWRDLPTPFTVLTGAFGNGELGEVAQPQHPHSLALARLLLAAGADPNDAQTLYNRQFRDNDDHLVLLFEFGLGRGDGGPWKARLGESLDAPAALVHGQLSWAVVHGMTARVALLADNGADLAAPFADGRTPTTTAALNGQDAVVELLLQRGAPPPVLDPAEAMVAALLTGDRALVDQRRREHPDALERARAERPGLIVWAYARGRLEALPLLVELGFDVNRRARADVPREQEWETALHLAAGDGDLATAQRLLALGADPDVVDHRFAATPLGWAEHFEQPALVALLAPVTRGRT